MKIYLMSSEANVKKSSPDDATEIVAAKGHNMAAALWLSGSLPPRVLCAGLGKCGRCRVRFLTEPPACSDREKAFFSPAELQAGWRLACQHELDDDRPVELEAPVEDRERHAGAGMSFHAESGHDSAAIAFDLGTTSVFWQSMPAGDCRPDDMIASGRFINPQAGCGADVVSRLATALRPAGRKLLAALIRNSFKDVVAAHEKRGIAVRRICVAANTAMTDIFLDKDISGLAAAPFRQSHAGNEFFELAGLPEVYIPPLPAPFIGGDVSAGILALLASGVPRPFVLADMGTNGEFVLVDRRDRIFMLSVPLGPALEGCGTECGNVAAPGVITGFTMAPDGLRCIYDESHGPKAAGISATGYISLLTILHRLGLIDDSGHFLAGRMPLAKKLRERITGKGGRTRLDLPGGVWLSLADIETLQMVKAAFSLALKTIVKSAGLRLGDLAAFCLGGALGQHVKAADLIELGFVPAALAGRIAAHGNTSLQGAAMLASCPERGECLATLFRNARGISLSERPDFMTSYMDSMKFGSWG